MVYYYRLRSRSSAIVGDMSQAFEAPAEAASSPQVSDDCLSLEADVLVLGGGPAGTWAAWSAAAQGAKVVLADKGYCGTSGATAPAGVGVWYVPPDPELRSEARSSREAMGGHLAERSWMDRVLNKTYENVGRLA